MAWSRRCLARTLAMATTGWLVSALCSLSMLALGQGHPSKRSVMRWVKRSALTSHASATTWRSLFTPNPSMARANPRTSSQLRPSCARATSISAASSTTVCEHHARSRCCDVNHSASEARLSALNNFESRTPASTSNGMSPTGTAQAAITNGPKTGPRPASSTPPRMMAASEIKVVVRHPSGRCGGVGRRR